MDHCCDDGERVLIAKEALLAEISQELASLRACRHLMVAGVVPDPARVHGGNWKLTGFLRLGHDHDELECQKTMVDYMADMQDMFDVGFDEAE